MTPAPSVDCQKPRSSPACILLVDDDEDFVDLLAQALRDDGHRVIVGRNGTELVDYILLTCRSGSLPAIDLVVSDVRMPQESGLQALQRLGRSPLLPRILLMTAFGSEDLHNAAARLGAIGVLDKPFDIDTFRTVVRCLVGNSN